VGRKLGVTEKKLLALADYESSPDLTDLEKLAIRYAVEMMKTPVEVPDELFAELQRNLSDKQIVELTSAIAWENYRARNNHALGVESEGFSKGAFCPLPERSASPQRR
jgi:alkylhydroperoxidase family enzyme